MCMKWIGSFLLLFLTSHKVSQYIFSPCFAPTRASSRYYEPKFMACLPFWDCQQLTASSAQKLNIFFPSLFAIISISSVRWDSFDFFLRYFVHYMSGPVEMNGAMNGIRRKISKKKNRWYIYQNANSENVQGNKLENIKILSEECSNIIPNFLIY